MHVNACLAAAAPLVNRELSEHEEGITSICRRFDRMSECHDAVGRSQGSVERQSFALAYGQY
jgi:hypothetical protein